MPLCYDSSEDLAIINYIKQLLSRNGSDSGQERKAVIVPPTEHTITIKVINHNARRVLERLQGAGFAAYIVGGGVRDLLLGYEPKDFDVATDARPEQIQNLFNNCRLIGRRFRLAHIYFHQGLIEVATFRAHETDKAGDRHHSDAGVILRDNVYGNISDDVWRRDFTINAIYYNFADGSLVDYTGGIADLKNRLIRIIGDPVQRYREDPVRMLRAVRLAAKLNLQIESSTAAPMQELAPQLRHVAAARLFEEILKIYNSGKAVQAFHLLQDYHLFKILFPLVEKVLNKPTFFNKMFEIALAQADLRTSTGKTLHPAFLLAVLLWGALLETAEELQSPDLKYYQAFYQAMDKVVKQQLETLHVPRRLVITMREIWTLQFRLELKKIRKIHSIFYHPRFRAAYDFLLLRAQANESDEIKTAADWWTQYQLEDETGRHEMESQLIAKKRRSRKSKPKSQQND